MTKVRALAAALLLALALGAPHAASADVEPGTRLRALLDKLPPERRAEIEAAIEKLSPGQRERILERYEDRGLRIVGLKLMQADRSLAEQHYAVHRDKPFFAGLVEFITSGPLVAIAVEGLNAVAVCRAINGATRPHEAAPGTIRGDLALETGQNLVHASDSVENAAQELDLWFAAGGFAPVAVGEDHELWTRARALGATLVGCSDMVVRTSARTRGRAPGGFAALLADLTREPGYARSQS